MRDEKKTKRQLINELKELRQRVTELETLETQHRQTEELWMNLFMDSPIGICIIQDGKFQLVNPQFEKQTGYSKDELLSTKSLNLVLLEDKEMVRENAIKMLKGERLSPYEYRGVNQAGEVRWILEKVSSIKYQGRRAVLGNFMETTERKRMEEELSAAQQYTRILIDSSLDIIISVDQSRTIVEFNLAAQKELGYSKAEILGKHVDILYADPAQGLEIHETVRRTGRFTGEIVNRRKNGETFPSFLAASIMYNAKSEFLGVMGISRNITESKLAEEQIRFLSFHDKLTGLYNRAYFEEELKRLDTERQLPLSIIIGDVNGLKLVNDAFGHLEGDKLLCKIAQTLRLSCRKEDLIARWGGDEFAILLPKTDENGALEVCTRIRKSCSETEKEPIPLSISLGAVTKEKRSQDIRRVVMEAEDRMYQHKLLESKGVRHFIISSLEKIVWETSHETQEHAQRLQEMAIRMGRAIEISNSKLDELTLLAALHDIGKVAIPSEILGKPGSLTPEEWEIIKKHPEIGYRIAESVPDLARIAEQILHHHEWWNGAGYPHGLKEEHIPLNCRIIAIVDTYDVMTHGRPYMRAVNTQEALEKIKRCAGNQFDPKLVSIFVEMISSTLGHELLAVDRGEPGSIPM